MYTQVYTTLYIPGYTRMYTVRTVNIACTLVYVGATVTRPWAQLGNNPWVRALVRVNVVNSVMGGRSLRRVLLRLPENKL